MSKSDYFENANLRLWFNGDEIDGLAVNDPTSPVEDLIVALHTAEPTEGGDQTQFEIAYTGYERVAVPRTTEGWVVSGSSAFPVEPITFPEMLGGVGGSATWASIGTGISNRIMFKGPITPAISVTLGVTPQLKGFSDTPPSEIEED